jgi:hypothetical protein
MHFKLQDSYVTRQVRPVGKSEAHRMEKEKFAGRRRKKKRRRRRREKAV